MSLLARQYTRSQAEDDKNLIATSRRRWAGADLGGEFGRCSGALLGREAPAGEPGVCGRFEGRLFRGTVVMGR